MQLHARNRIESSAQSRAQRKCPTSSSSGAGYLAICGASRGNTDTGHAPHQVNITFLGETSPNFDPGAGKKKKMNTVMTMCTHSN